MSKKETVQKQEGGEVEDTITVEKTCFVIMPISDHADYAKGHFNRVYEYLIKPAVEEAGFIPKRADDTKRTNMIALEIVRDVIECDMAICDLSSRNPNVLYEAGLRQAFNKPVTFLKDLTTQRIFDIQNFRDVEYDATLRVDLIKNTIPLIAEAIADTYKNDGKDINSLVSLLGIKPAEVKSTEVSNDTKILLNAIEGIGKRVDDLEATRNVSHFFGNDFIQPPSILPRSNMKFVSLTGNDILNLKKGTVTLYKGTQVYKFESIKVVSGRKNAYFKDTISGQLFRFPLGPDFSVPTVFQIAVTPNPE
ncbi:MAG: hypothetical protein ACK4E0_06465 [Chitinophagaceae bacterium]